MLNTKYSLRVLNAAWEMLQAYDELIKDPHGRAKRWESYGEFRSCKLCEAVCWPAPPSGSSPYRQCRFCPLDLPPHSTGCVRDTAHQTTYQLRLRAALHDLICKGSAADSGFLVQAATARKEWLVQRMGENGVTVQTLRRAHEAWTALEA